jgi:radical SAM protein with 4Fe4S-binding SPASM domain
MNRPATCLQIIPTVRLRRESWGGVAFDRAGGDLLELDAEAFPLLVSLRTAQSLPTLLRIHPGRRGELISLLQTLERRGFIQRVAADAAPLAVDHWATRDVSPCGDGLRAPLVAHWAVTYRCNLHCAFCYSESSPERSLGPNARTRREIVTRLAEWGVLKLALGGGEPTILPDFADLLSAIRAANMVPNVTTNGTISSEAVVRALATHAGVVHLSADRPELLDAARGQGVFARLGKTAVVLLAAGVRLGINLLLTPYNAHDLRRSLEALLDLGVQTVTLLRPKGAWAAEHWPGFPTANDLARMADDLRCFMETKPPLRLYVDTALRGEWVSIGLLHDPEPEVRGCGGGQRHVAVTPEGDVYACSHQRRPEYRLGNLLADDAVQLWSKGIGWAGRQRYCQDSKGVRCPCVSL